MAPKHSKSKKHQTKNTATPPTAPASSAATHNEIAAAASAVVTTPQQPPSAGFVSLLHHDTSRTLLYFAAFCALGALFFPKSKADVASNLFAKTLGNGSQEALADEMAAPIPGGFPGVAPAAAAEAEEPPVPPPPTLEGPDNFTGQVLENPCILQENGACQRYAMDSFYQQMARVLRKENNATVLISHFGDSIVASDYISSRARLRIQQLLGDAGHGFLYIGQPSRWYFQENVIHKTDENWKTRAVSGTLTKDGLYGFGGASFEANAPGLTLSVATAKDGEIGTAASKLDVYYLAQPNGGDFSLSVDGTEQQTVSTKAEQTQAAVASLSVPDGPHRFQLKSLGANVRAFGVALSRSGPGAIYDSLGLVGGSAKGLVSIDAAHWKQALQQRNPHLLVFMFGTNEANYTGTSKEAIAEYQATQETLLRRVREALPEASCLLMSPLDSAEEKDGELVTKPVVPKLVEAQRNAAKNVGCAFWDSFSWMGGKGSMAKWYKRGLAASDYAHPSKRGAAMLGDAFFDALVDGYRQYSKRQVTP